MKFLVCGGRDVTDDNYVNLILDLFIGNRAEDVVLIHGDARGVDRLAGEWAHRRGYKVWPFPADWDKYGKSAGYIRNSIMLEEGKPDAVIAIKGGKGTKMMVQLAEDANIPRIIFD